MLSQEQIDKVKLHQGKVSLAVISDVANTGRTSAITKKIRNDLVEEKVLDENYHVIQEQNVVVEETENQQLSSIDYFQFVNQVYQLQQDLAAAKNDEEDMPECHIFALNMRLDVELNVKTIANIKKVLVTKQMISRFKRFTNQRRIRDINQFFKNVAYAIRHYEAEITFGEESMNHKFGDDVGDFLSQQLGITDGDSFFSHEDVGIRLFEVSGGQIGLTHEERQALEQEKQRALCELDLQQGKALAAAQLEAETLKELEAKERITRMTNKIRNFFKKDNGGE